MKVALISNEGGGISSVTAGLSKSLAKRKVETTVFTGIIGSECQTQKLDEYREIVRLPVPDIPPRNLLFQLRNFNKLSEALNNYTIVHGVSPTASFGFTFFRKRIPKPFVTTIHDSYRSSQKVFFSQPLSSWTSSELGYFFLESPLVNFSLRRILSGSTHTTFCSYSVLAELSAYRNVDYDKISVIHNGIDLDEIESVKNEQNVNSGEITIIYAGRLFYVKGVMLLLEAFSRLKDVKGVRLKIFGKGPLKQKIEKFIVDHGLKDSVSCLGYVPHRELIGEIMNADALVFPSLSEAQPMIVLEAMACRKPVVAFDLPFAREIISDMSNGLLVKASDIGDLCMKIRLIVSDGKLRSRLGQAAHDYVRKNHNWDIQVDKYLSVYERAIETNDKIR
jgi:glycosyltransferase involved in cell wall biosynthesis